jgi:hypothetical protein
MFKNIIPDKEDYTYLRTLMPALLHKSAYGILEEQDQMPFLYKEARKITSFGDIPLYVLTATDSDRFDNLISDEKLKKELLDVSAKMQKDLLKLSLAVLDSVLKLRETMMVLNYGPQKTLERAKDVEIAERIVDDIYRALTIKVLTSKLDVPVLLLLRDVLQLLENSADKAEDAADAARTISFIM